MLENCEIAFIRLGRGGGEGMENDIMGPGLGNAGVNLSHSSNALKGMFYGECVKPC